MDLANAFSNINWASVTFAAVASFFIGGIWYGPLFGRAWMVAFELTEDDLAKRNIPMVFGIALFLALIAAIILDLFIGVDANLAFGASAGFFAGFGWVATMLGILYLFEMKPLKAWLINAGYCTLALSVMGATLGAW